MKSLIIGITGCLGSHLAEYLLGKGYEVFGTKRHVESLDNIEYFLNRVKIFDVELDDKESILKTLKESAPDQIYFLASANRFDSLENIYKTNVKGTIIFFESIAALSYISRVILTSSSAAYGIQKDVRSLREDNELLPSTHYGLGKVFQEKIANYYFRNYNLDIIIARPFNFTGPRENPFLVCTDFARQIVDIENGNSQPIIKVGNLQAERDFTDVRDTAKAYELLAIKGVKGEVYNICSGKVYSIQTILNKLLSMSEVDIKIEIDSGKLRKREIDIQIGDNSKISSLTGWKPQISLDKTLEDILNYNRNLKRG